MGKLKLNALGLGLGSTLALFGFLGGLLALAGVYEEAYKMIMIFHFTADLSVVGIILHAVENFIAGYVFGVVLAWAYNRFA